MKTQRITQLVTAAVFSAAALMPGVSQASEFRGGYSHAMHDSPRAMDRHNSWRGDFRDGSHSIDARQAQQHMQIRQGLRNGTLTVREADRLMQQQRAIERLERRLEADGRLTPQERARLQDELDDARRSIRHQALDDDRRSNRQFGSGYWR
jgi:site-specific DNA-cytosine methylase